MRGWKKSRWWIGGATLATAIASLCLTTWPTELLQLPLTIHEQPQAADVVIVLGAGARKHGEPLPPQAKERIQRGVNLVKQGFASTMIVAGGLNKHSGYVEADLMKPDAVSQGLSADNVIEENRSINTWENAVNSLGIMDRNNWHSALVVTSPYHTLRACAVFRKLKATVHCIAAPLSIIPTNTVYERLTDFRSVVREYGAMVLFVWKHYL